MKSELRILFFADTEKGDVSAIHRCNMIAREMEKYSIHSTIYTGRTKAAIPNHTFISASLALRNFDILCLHKHGNPLAFMLLTLAKLMGKKVVLDFDDAVFAFGQKEAAVNHRTINRLWYSCFSPIVRRSDAVIAGGHYLAEYASRLNKNVHIIPTAVDTSIFKPMTRSYESSKITIGWMGQGNFHINNLRLLVEPLCQLCWKYPIRFKMVSALGVSAIKDMFSTKGLEFLDVDYGINHLVDIRKVPSLMSDFDISVAPLVSDPFSQGKCAIKVLESMAMGIPVVASAVGENSYVIKDGVNGFLASSMMEWVGKLEALIKSEPLRQNIGKAGLETTQESYTLEKCAEKFADVCLKLLGEK
jgi:glycosyltransferase involved in cell wall biosynthesis